MKKILALALLFGFFSILSAQKKEKTPVDYVNPFIGTNYMGHTFPGATVPFGMVQLSPDTEHESHNVKGKYNKTVYRYCAGYQYEDKTIVGFSHTHFHGTGHSDLGDFLLMPTTGKIQLEPGTAEEPEKGYRSRFSHSTEKASPGYYKVKLEDYDIDAELTSTDRVGIHKYKYNNSEKANLILDLVHGIYDYDGKVVWASVRVENDTLVTGFRQTNGWARTKYIYFAMSFSRPIKSYGLREFGNLDYKGFWRKWNQEDNFPERAGKKLKGFFKFDLDESKELVVRFALSGTGTAGAVKNLKAEAPHNNFEKYKKEAVDKWNKELSKVKIEADENKKVIFYTALYHSGMSPVIYSDVDGKYRGLDQNIHTAKGYQKYTIFSLWDTFRAFHPLQTILNEKRTSDMVNSMLSHYNESVHKILPVWSHHSNDNWCMIGYHAVPVIADAVMKDIKGFDYKTALEAVVSSATYGKYDGLEYYMNMGFVPADKNSSAASKTLEYAYDDWTIYQMAKKLGDKKTEVDFKKRALNYKNLFCEETGFMRAKNFDGSWKTPFDPLNTHGQGYIEGNAWNYSLFVPHDVQGFVNLLGSKEKLTDWLDKLFTMDLPEESYAGSEDVEKVGIIGNYVHGNEPSHHVPYMYNFVGQPWKTQEKVTLINKTMYRNETDGLCGNDDCGQMSAWYIFSSIGFYPVAPGSNQYVIGSPFIDRAEINLENGNKFTMVADNLSDKNIYIKEIYLNGRKYDKLYINHSEIMKGGTLRFVMDLVPNKSLGKSDNSVPYNLTK